MTAAHPPNRSIYCGDNLPFLRGLGSGSIHLIATDPPFNKDRDFPPAFGDRWARRAELRDEWMAGIRRDHPALRSLIDTASQTGGPGMGAYLCWLGIRLLEMRRALRDDGSLYLHMDFSAGAYVKLLLDAIFGASRFRNEIVWHYKTGGLSKRWFGRKHDTILFYSKSDRYTFHPQREKSYLRHHYGFANITIERDQGGPYRMVAMRDVWDIPALRGNQAEATGYPTQKPLALYERIIRASSNPGDIVLDPFCGSGTCAVAAEKLGRRWLAADRWQGVIDLLRQRLEHEGLPGASRDLRPLP